MKLSKQIVKKIENKSPEELNKAIARNEQRYKKLKDARKKGSWQNVSEYTDDPIGIHLMDVRDAGINSDNELKALKGININKEALDWLEKQCKTREKKDRLNVKDFIKPQHIVWIGCKRLDRVDDKGKPVYKEYKNDKELLGNKAWKKWRGWHVDISTARAWNSYGNEAAYSDSQGYINVNGVGLHRLVYMSYLLDRARKQTRYKKILKEFLSDPTPYQVHHIVPKKKGERAYNTIVWLRLERVEEMRPNNHQNYTNIERKINKSRAKKNKNQH